MIIILGPCDHADVATARAQLESHGVTIPSDSWIQVEGDRVCLLDSDPELDNAAPVALAELAPSFGLSLTCARAEGAVIAKQAARFPAGTAGLTATREKDDWAVVPVDAAGTALSAGWLVMQNADLSVSVTSR